MSELKNDNEKLCINNIEEDYYKAYEKRYSQVYEHNYLWSDKNPSPDVMETIKKYKIVKNKKILEIGCGEGRDAINLLNNGYNVLATDYSKTVIEKCKELSNYKYSDNFKQLNIITDNLNMKFDFIYSIAVIHMFVKQGHRNKFYQFIYNHLDENGIALIASMGDGVIQKESDIMEAFNDVERTVMNNKKILTIANTSCKIVDWKTFEEELLNNNLIIKEKWISKEIPEFDSSMCVVVSKKIKE